MITAMKIFYIRSSLPLYVGSAKKKMKKHTQTAFMIPVEDFVLSLSLKVELPRSTTPKGVEPTDARARSFMLSFFFFVLLLSRGALTNIVFHSFKPLLPRRRFVGELRLCPRDAHEVLRVYTLFGLSFISRARRVVFFSRDIKDLKLNVRRGESCRFCSFNNHIVCNSRLYKDV